MFRIGSRSGASKEGRQRHTVSLHITSSLSGRTFHRTLSLGVVRGLLILLAVLVVVAFVGFGGLVGWVSSAGRTHRLQTENDSLRVQFNRLGDLEKELARMSELNKKMQTMLGIDDGGAEAPVRSEVGGEGAQPAGSRLDSRSASEESPERTKAGSGANPR